MNWQLVNRNRIFVGGRLGRVNMVQVRFMVGGRIFGFDASAYSWRWE